MTQIAIQNEALKVHVFPEYGGKIASIVDKADDFELLFTYPRKLPTRPEYDIPYETGWYAGWDECFPGVSAGEYPAAPYKGIAVPDHGELWGLPTRVQSTADSVLTQWRGLRFGYELSRYLLLVGNTLEARYELQNASPFDFRFVWALHSLMNLSVPVEFALGYGDADQKSPWRLSHDAEGVQADRPFAWPRCSAGEDISRPLDLPRGRGWKIFSEQPIDRPFTITYPTRRRSLQIAYESDSRIAAYWGIWINTGGWNNHYHFAVEPTTGTRDRLDESVANASAARVAPLATVEWTVRWTVG